MTIALILLFSLLTVVLGRSMFGGWFNHVGMYGFIWGSSLALFHVGLIAYYPLETETWMAIAAGWGAFVLGSAVIVGARYAALREGRAAVTSSGGAHAVDPSQLVRILWIVNVITVADAIYELYNVSRILGGVSNILALGNLLYSLRSHEGIPGAIPYVGTLTMTGSLLAGYYTAKVGKLRLVAIVAVLTAIMISVASMVRASLIMAAILFLTGYLVERKKGSPVSGKGYGLKLKRVLSIFAMVVLIVAAMELIRGNRGMTEGFEGETSTLKKLGVGAGSFITPSVFMYLTVHHGVLNQYLRKGTEDVPVGHYTFAPVWRVLSRLGFDTYVKQHGQFYRVPMQANTGSYLRDLHADYGFAGLVFGPFLLGMVSSVYWYRFKKNYRLSDLVILGHVYVGVGMSLFAFMTQMGVWLGSLLFGLIISLLSTLIARRRSGTERRSPAYG